MNPQFTQTIITDDVLADAPYRYGYQDALEGKTCVPEMYFGSYDAITHYTLGYVAVAGESPTTKQLLQTYGQGVHRTLTEVKWERQYKSYGWFTVAEETVRQAINLPEDEALFFERMRQGKTIQLGLYTFRAYQEEPVHAAA